MCTRYSFGAYSFFYYKLANFKDNGSGKVALGIYHPLFSCCYKQIGLAVGDIDKIQQKSVMARYVMQV